MMGRKSFIISTCLTFHQLFIATFHFMFSYQTDKPRSCMMIRKRSWCADQASFWPSARLKSYLLISSGRERRNSASGALSWYKRPADRLPWWVIGRKLFNYLFERTLQSELQVVQHVVQQGVEEDVGVYERLEIAEVKRSIGQNLFALHIFGE